MNMSYHLTIAAILVMSMAALLHSTPVSLDSDSEDDLEEFRPEEGIYMSEKVPHKGRHMLHKPEKSKFSTVKKFFPSSYQKFKALFKKTPTPEPLERVHIKLRFPNGPQVGRVRRPASWAEILDEVVADMKMNHPDRFPWLLDEKDDEDDDFDLKMKSKSMGNLPHDIEPEKLKLQQVYQATVSSPSDLRAPKEQPTNVIEPGLPYNPFMSKKTKTLLELFQEQDRAYAREIELNIEKGPRPLSPIVESEPEKNNLPVEEKNVNPKNSAASPKKSLGAVRKSNNILNKDKLPPVPKKPQPLSRKDSWDAWKKNAEMDQLQRIVAEKPQPKYKPLVGKRLPKTVDLGRGVKIDLTNYVTYFPDIDTVEFSDETHKISKMFPTEILSKKLYNPDSYMDRKFTKLRNNPKGNGMPLFMDEVDTPELVADFFTRGDKSCVLIYGTGLSGKTTSLIRAHETMHKLNPEMWTTFIPLGKYAKEFTAPFTKPEQIFKLHFDQSMDHEIFEILLDRNPEKINLIIDDIHTLPKPKIKLFLNYFSELSQRGVGVVISSLLEINKYISPEMNIGMYYIPILSVPDITTILEKIWLKRLPQAEPYLVKDYAEIVAKKLVQHSDDIPQDFKTLKVIADAFVSPTAHDMGILSDYWTAEDYIGRKVSNREKLELSLEALKLDKYKLFKQFMDNYRLTSREDIEQCSLYAFRSVLKANTRAAQKLHIGDFDSELNTDSSTRELLDYIKLIHPEYEYYLAAYYVTTYLEHDDFTPEAGEIFGFMIANPDNLKILEYLNRPDASMYRGLFLHLADNPGLWNHAMDTAMLNGLDYIAAYLFDAMQTQDRSHIWTYFSNSVSVFNPAQKQKYSSYSFGIHFETEKKIIERKEAFFIFHNMLVTIDFLYQLNNENNKDKPLLTDEGTYAQYLDYITTLVTPPDGKLMRIACQLVKNLPNVEKSFTNLLKNVITYSKINTVKSIEILVEAGAKLEEAFPNGVEELLHVAASKLDVQLLDYLEKKLSVSCSAFMPSLLLTVFDASPFHQYSPPEFWKTVDFLISRADKTPVPQPNDPELQLQFIGPTVADKENILFKLIAGTDDIKAANVAIDELKVSPQTLDKLSLGVRNYRKNSILYRGDDELREQDPTCWTEIILKYRGLGDLTIDEQRAYESSVQRALNNDIERGELTESQLKRIRHNLMANLGTLEDLEFTKLFSKRLLRYPKFVDYALERYWQSRMNHKYNTMDFSAIEMGILPTRNDLYVKLEKKKLRPNEIHAAQLNEKIEAIANSKVKKQVAFEEPKIKSFTIQVKLDANEISKKKLSNPCKNRGRQRRSASNCLITDEEYDEIVKVSNEGNEQTFTIDTDKFLEQMDASSAEKYLQYKQLGRQLLEKEGTKLNGISASIFEEYVQPEREHSIEAGGAADLTGQPADRISNEKLSSHLPLQAPGDFRAHELALRSGCGGPFQRACGITPDYHVHKEFTEYPHPHVETIHSIPIGPPQFGNIPRNDFITPPKIHLEPPINVNHYLGTPHIQIAEISAPKTRFTPRITARG